MTRENRQDEIRKIQKDYKWLYAVILGVIVLGIGVWIGASMFKEDGGYGVNLFTELLGIGVTVFIIDQLRAYRDKGSLKRRLVREAGSRSNDIALSAVDELRANGWLIGDDGLLKGAMLLDANLQKAILDGANLQEVNLARANLEDARLKYANLRGANLNVTTLNSAFFISADLEGASLHAFMEETVFAHANLQCADMEEAYLFRADMQLANMCKTKLRKADLRGADLLAGNLQDADLSEADLHGANLLAANLRGANLDAIKDLNHATLPDEKNFSLDTDIKRYTDPDHPDFNATLELINDIRKEHQIEAIPISEA